MPTTSSARRTSSSAALLALAVLAAAARADVLHVPKDFPTVAEALAAAQAGDEIVLAAGSYNTPILIDDVDGIVLRGQGKVVLGGGTDVTPALTLENSDHVTVDHLRIEGAQGTAVFAGPGADDLVLSRLRIEDCAGTGIVAGESSGVLIDRCRVEGAGGHGISILEAGEFTLSRCTVVDAGGIGIDVGDAQFITVDRCHVTGSGQSGIAMGFSGPSHHGVLSRNVVIDAGTNGLFVRGAENVVTENRVQGAGGAGVLLHAESVGGIVEDNTLVDAGVGLDVGGTGLLVRDNRVVTPVLEGIIVRQDLCVVGDDRVTKPGGDGYLLEATVDGGALLGCKAQHAGDDGFEIACSALSITGNSSLGADADGFEVLGDFNVLAANSAHGSGVLDLEVLGAQSILLANDVGTSNLP